MRQSLIINSARKDFMAYLQELLNTTAGHSNPSISIMTVPWQTTGSKKNYEPINQLITLGQSMNRASDQ